MKKTIEWLMNNINKEEGVIIHSNNRMSYPEVSGYLIPTLLNLGYSDEAIRIGEWLAKIQSNDGAICLGNDKYLFDTAMVLMGWQSLRTVGTSRFNDNIELASKFINNQINIDGSFKLQYHMSNEVPEKILIWCATLIEKEGYNVNKVFAHYGDPCVETTFQFNCLSHFHCYVLDALFEAKQYIGSTKEAIHKLSLIQRTDGSIPAYSNVQWVCYTGVAQSAILFYKVGLKENGDKAMKYLASVMNDDGSFYGCSTGGNYFPNDKISWAAKFYVDAYQLMIEKHMDAMADQFPQHIDDGDIRCYTLKKHLTNGDILDIGCGRGKYELQIASSEQNFYGVDTSSCLVDHCTKNIANIKEVKKGLATNIPYDNSRFDCAFSIEVYEHIPYLVENALKEVIRILKPCGKFILIDKNITFQGGKEEWEDWFDMVDMTSLMSKYFKNVEVYKLDNQFVCWVGVK